MAAMPEVKKTEEIVEEAAPEKPPESEEESDEDMGFGLFDQMYCSAGLVMYSVHTMYYDWTLE